MCGRRCGWWEPAVWGVAGAGRGQGERGAQREGGREGGERERGRGRGPKTLKTSLPSHCPRITHPADSHIRVPNKTHCPLPILEPYPPPILPWRGVMRGRGEKTRVWGGRHPPTPPPLPVLPSRRRPPRPTRAPPTKRTKEEMAPPGFEPGTFCDLVLVRIRCLTPRGRGRSTKERLTIKPRVRQTL